MKLGMSRSSPGLFAWLSACLSGCLCGWLGPGVGSAQTAPTRDEAFFEVYRRADPVTSWPLKKLLHTIPELKGLKPDDSQANLPAILSGLARNLQLFLKDFADTASVETVDESRMRDTTDSAEALALLGPRLDTPAERTKEKFRYITLADPGSGGLSEYRTDLQGHQANTVAASVFAKTAGFVTLPFFFAAGAQSLSSFRSLGSQTIGNHPCQVVAFAEHVMPLAVRGSWQSGAISIPLILQGIAWIDPAIDQIVRLRTDLLAPQPDARLRRLTTVILFEPVKFESRPVAFWLPQEVKVTIDINDYTFENRHQYSEYQLFKVEMQQTLQEPKPDTPRQH